MGPEYAVDDIILDEVHAGYGLGPPGAAALGEWSRTVEVDISVDDVLYVRGFSDTKSSIGQSTEIGVGRGPGHVLSHTVTQIANPETYYFDGLIVGVPEPSPLTFVVPALAFWSLRRGKRKKRRDAQKS
jgi:hypothetical protein